MSNKYLFFSARAILLFVIGFILECALNGEIIWLPLEKSAELKFLKHYSFWTVVLLALMNLGLFFLEHRDLSKKNEYDLHDRICKVLFDSFVKSNSNILNQSLRISTFILRKGWYWEVYHEFKFLNKMWYLSFPKQTTRFVNYGRSQTRGDKQKCKIKFRNVEGILGMTFSIGEIVAKKIDVTNSTFIHEQLNTLNVPEYKAKKLKDEPCNYLCLPITYYSNDDIYGCLVVDSTEYNDDLTNEFRELEQQMNNFTVFFKKN